MAYANGKLLVGNKYSPGLQYGKKKFTVPMGCKVTLDICDGCGKEIKDFVYRARGKVYHGICFAKI